MHRALRGGSTSIWSILAVALILRIWFAWDYVRSRPQHALGIIPFLFEPGNIAHSLATGHGFGSPFLVNTGPTAWMTPIYPAILAAIFRLFGIYTYHAFMAAVALNIACVVLVCLPILRIGTRIGGVGVGAGAAWLWAIFPNAILIPVESLWDACLATLLLALLLWATLALGDAHSVRPWVGYGLLWGLALMVNPSLGSVFPILSGWAGYQSRKSAVAWMRKPLLSLGVAFLCCVPWTIRNYTVFHALVPLRSVMGLPLWLGNNADAGQRTVGEMHPISSSAEREQYVALGEITYMKLKKDEAVAYMVGHPRRTLRLTANRFVSFWSGGSAHPIDDFRRNQSLWFRYVLLFNLAAGIAGLVGIAVLYRKRDRCTLPVASLPVLFPWVYYLTVVQPRYRLPIDPVVLLLTAVALHVVVRRWSDPRLPSAMPARSQAHV